MSDNPFSRPPVAPRSADNPSDPEASLTVRIDRMIDAAANRTQEGLRVVEDFLRFAWEDRFLTETTKNIRQHLTHTLRDYEASVLSASRETQLDPGTQLDNNSRQTHADLPSAVVANLKRVQQGLRSLEETTRLRNVDTSLKLQQLRYRCYTLEKAILATTTGNDALQDAQLYVLVDGRTSENEFATLVGQLVKAQVGAIQLRDKQLDDRALIARAKRLRQLTAGTRVLAIMNDRADIAVAADLDGVHVGQDELSVHDVRRVVGNRVLVGVSTHSLEQARTAVTDGANYIGIGPVFPSHTKSFQDFIGLELIAKVAQEVSLPTFAIGGIGPKNLAQVLDTGIQRVAVGDAITSAQDIAAAVTACQPGKKT